MSLGRLTWRTRRGERSDPSLVLVRLQQANMCYIPLSRFTGSVECCISIILLSSISENSGGKYDLVGSEFKIWPKLSTSRSQFVGQILNSDLASSYFPFNTPTVTVTEKFGVQRKIWILEEKFGINCDLRWIIWNKLFFGRGPIWHREGY